MLNIIGKRKIWFTTSGALVVASIIMISFWGLKLGIDFTGGTLLEASYLGLRPENQVVQEALAGFNLGNIAVQPVGETGLLLKFKDTDEDTHKKITSALKELVKPPAGVKPEAAFEEQSFTSIGPTIGQELWRRSLTAIVAVLTAIILYIAWAFRKVSRPVKSWKYGLIAILALFHDLTIPIGIFAALGKFFAVEIDILFITAMLTVLGFSVHDTIVVFDRIRENLTKKGSANFEAMVNASVNETVVRSINTSLTVLMVLLAVFFFGGESIRYFALTLILGIIFGTYSSIFIASPLLVSWHNWSTRRKR